MLLNIIRNGEKVNTFTGKETVTSFVNNLYGHDQKTGTVKKMIIKPGKSAEYVNISFTLNNGLPDVLEYNYIDIPYSGGLLDIGRVLENQERAAWIAYRTPANGNGWYKYLLVNITDKTAVYNGCGSLIYHIYDNALKVSNKELQALKDTYIKAGYEMKEL